MFHAYLLCNAYADFCTASEDCAAAELQWLWLLVLWYSSSADNIRFLLLINVGWIFVGRPSSVGPAEKYVQIVLRYYRTSLQYRLEMIIKWDLHLPKRYGQRRKILVRRISPRACESFRKKVRLVWTDAIQVIDQPSHTLSKPYGKAINLIRSDLNTGTWCGVPWLTAVQ